MNITVYLGANEGNDPCLRKAVEELGAWIGNSGNALVYGGSKGGLMGALADSVLKAGGDVTGVEPNFFIENEFQHDGLTKLIVTKDMSERKNKMIELQLCQMCHDVCSDSCKVRPCFVNGFFMHTDSQIPFLIDAVIRSCNLGQEHFVVFFPVMVQSVFLHRKQDRLFKFFLIDSSIINGDFGRNAGIQRV